MCFGEGENAGLIEIWLSLVLCGFGGICLIDSDSRIKVVVGHFL